MTPADSLVPICTLVIGSDAALYGTSAAGGVSNVGTVFRLNKDGSGFSILKSFVGTNGQTPIAGLIEGIDGFLYGTTFSGGISNAGTVFKLDKNGNGFAVLHGFLTGADGVGPKASLIEGTDGALYGVTDFANSATRGTIFKLDKSSGNYSVIHTFTGNPDGQQNNSRLLEGSDGALYGTTPFGGTSIRGVVFKTNKDGGGHTILHNFAGGVSDGRLPMAGLIEASDGVLYGTTEYGGTENVGTVFKLNKDGGGFALIRSFSNAVGQINRPNAELVEGSDGALYGCTYQGGTASVGGIYRLNKDGSGYTVLRNFGTGGDGQSPKSALVTNIGGIFFGTTQYGAGGAGCVFALSPAPFAPRALVLVQSNNLPVIQFAGTASALYDVQRSTNLLSWSNMVTLTAPPHGRVAWTNSGPLPSAAFYRVRSH